MKRILAGMGIGARSPLGTTSTLGTAALLGATALLATSALVAPAATAVPAPVFPVSAVPNSSWSPWLACPGNATQNCASVRAITRAANGTVIIGGDFSQLRSPTGQVKVVSNLAALDDSGTPVSSFATHTFNGTVFTLANDGTSVYAGGAFSKIDGKGALHLAKFVIATGAQVTGFKSAITSTSPTGGAVDGSVLADGQLYIGGKFDHVQGLVRGNLAAVDPATGTVNPTWAPNAELIPNDAKPNDPAHNNVPVRALAATADGTRIYIAGDMDTLNGVARPAIAAVSPSTGIPLPTSQFNPSPVITKAYQGMAIAVVDPSSGLTPGLILAAGGLFNQAWRLNTNGSIAWQVNPDGDVQAAAVMGSTVFLGGHFACVSAHSCFDNSSVGDYTAIHIAAFDYNGANFQTPDQRWTPALGPTTNPYYYGVWALQVYGSSLYVGGVFKNVISNGVTYPDAKYVRFGPPVSAPPPPPPPPPGSTLFTDDFSSNTPALWNQVGGGMTVANGVATAVTPGKIGYLGRTLSTAPGTLDFSAQVKITALDPKNKVILMRVLQGKTGLVNLSIRPDGTVGLRDEVTQADWAHPTKLSLGSWHTLDLKLTVAGTAGHVAVSVDGTPIPQLTATGNFGTTAPNAIQIGDTGGQRSCTIGWDNVTVKSG